MPCIVLVNYSNKLNLSILQSLALTYHVYFYLIYTIFTKILLYSTTFRHSVPCKADDKEVKVIVLRIHCTKKTHLLNTLKFTKYFHIENFTLSRKDLFYKIGIKSLYRRGP